MTRKHAGTVAGIDVGGDRKGCHLVIVRGVEILCSMDSREPDVLAQCCRDFGVLAVGIDSPCRWGLPGLGRQAEKALAAAGMSAFATPTRERAAANASGLYGWMFNGERVYSALAATHPPLAEDRYREGTISFETFPHAITCAALGADVASAKRKGEQRRQVLQMAGIDPHVLTSIDAVDAALCALAAGCLLQGNTRAFGDPAGGYIIVPASGWLGAP